MPNYKNKIRNISSELDDMREFVDKMIDNINDLDDDQEHEELLAMRDGLEDISDKLNSLRENLRQ